MLKYKGTYEIISPEDIGLARANESGIVLGKLRYGSFCDKKQTMPLSFGSCIGSSALIFGMALIVSSRIPTDLVSLLFLISSLRG